MSKSIRIVSPNIVRDREFRALLQASATGGGHPGPDEELGLIVKQALGKGSDKTFKLSEGEAADVYEAVEKNSNREVGNRDQVEVKAKLFLRDFSAEKAKEAIKHTLTVLGTELIDNIQLAVPASGVDSLTIGPEAKPVTNEYTAALDKLVSLWNDMEAMLADGTVKSMGLCDVETRTLDAIYQRAEQKPSSITVNLRSCCVVPPELSEFSRSNGIKLLTHSDPEAVLKDEQLRGLGEEKGKLALDYVIRYQVMDVERGVLMDKRYIVSLGANRT